MKGAHVSQHEAMNDLRALVAGVGEGRRLPRWIMAVPGIAALVGAQFVAAVPLSLALEAFGCVLLAVAFYALATERLSVLRQQAALRAVSDMVEQDAALAYVTDMDGRILYRNRAAKDRPPTLGSETVGHALRDFFANPAAVMFRLQDKAATLGAAREDIVTRRGHVRLSVARLSGDQVLWRLEDLSEREGGRQGGTLSLPMLTAGPSGTILFMNDPFRRLIGGRAKTLEAVFADLPLVSGRRHKVLTEGGEVETLVAEVPGHGGRREIYLLPGDGSAEVGTALARATTTAVATDWDAIEELPVPLLKVAPTGEVLASNREARVLLKSGIGAGTRLSDLLEGLGRSLVDWLHESVQGRGSLKPEFLRAANSDEDTYVQVSLNPGGDPETPHVIAVLNDVTELKTLEQQFNQAQKMQAIGQLAGGVAHDFNNLLTAISGHCDLLLLRHDQGDTDFSDLQQIHQNANRAAALVGQLLAFSRKQNLRPEVLDLRNTLSELTHLLNRLVGEKITLTLDHDPGLEPVRADKRQLEQVMVNLVVNARDAMPEGGEIRVTTRNVDLSAPLSRDRATVPPGRYALLEVIDTGTGIAPEIRERIFEPFFTTKELGEGTGLGLSTAYGIVKQTGGFIFADSAPGQGTTFRVYIPTHDDALQIAEAKAPVAQPADTAPRAPEPGEGVILLVEDESPVRAFAARALRLSGYTVLEADGGESALALLQDPDLRIDLFVTDVIMPGMDGPSWVRDALRDRPETRVVFVSGYAEETFAEEQGSIPNSVFLPKPFSLTDLTETVRRQLSPGA
ncbi:MAG: two-component system, cell cycle sensor histidine kinase and response regulator CckA [Rhodobacteraceae bacterium HLUCCA08]|nr:MAG: two-component system, cell cycle sensor histidine kinase and response regulator CckA [Rhodobacteraceae bacterium HLUCCA08]